MKITLITSFFLLLFFQIGIAQNIKAKIIDSATGETIPYANIKVNESESLVSNGEGYFTLSESDSRDETVLIISYLGFVSRKLAVAELKRLDYSIGLTRGIFQLDDVTVPNEKPNPYEIMANVKANLARNYKNEELPTKELLFYRKSDYFKPKLIDVEIDESTGFTKQGLSKVNTDLKAFSKKLISNPPREFTDVLCNYYTSKIKKNDKIQVKSKMDVLKATKLKNEGSSTSLEELEKTAMKTMLQHLDSTKYYRFKSGFFGSRDTISLRKDFNKKKNKDNSKEQNDQLIAAKMSLKTFLLETNFLEGEKLDFIKETERYDYKYEGTTYTNENEFAYVLSFKPRRSKAKYIGKLYVSESDYAILRADYVLDEGEKVSNFNMKFLLGLKVAENVSQGTITYKKKTEGNGYYMQYAAIEKGYYFYLNRPLKFIELTSSEKDVLSLDLKMEANSINKTEFLNMSRAKTTAAEIEKIKESNFKFTNIKSYDPTIWKDYNAIEPLQEMKQFKAID
jgi:hypothetical protein